MKFGIGYQGSKNRIARDLLSVLPSGERFVDLFAGGCAMTHAAMVSGKYNSVLANDLYPQGLKMFKDAMDGKYANENRWVSREDFFQHKDDDTEYGRYARICFSFGNNQKDYMYSHEIEPYKRACHYAVVNDDWEEFIRLCPEVSDYVKSKLDGISDINDRRLKFQNEIVNWMRKNGSLDIINGNPLYKSIKTKKELVLEDLVYHITLTSLQVLQNLEHSIRMQNLSYDPPPPSLPPLTISVGSYDAYEWRAGDVVYCDPPYSDTGTYCNRQFDHDAFWTWVRTRDFPVYVSEYNAPKDFVSIWSKSIPKRMKGGKSSRSKATECLYIHERWMDGWRK